jgi:lipopolysaccharide transport system ATP-binding protein
MKNGEIVSIGDTARIVNQYLSNESVNKTNVTWSKGKNPGDDVVILHSAKLVDVNGSSIEYATIDASVGIEFKYEILKTGYWPVPNVHVYTSKGEYVFVSGETQDERFTKTGVFSSTMWIPANLLNTGTYIIRIAATTMSPLRVHFWDTDTLVFDVIEDIKNRNSDFNQPIPGVVRPQLKWSTVQID